MLAAVCLLAILSTGPHVVDTGDGALEGAAADELFAGGSDDAAVKRLRALLDAWPHSTRRGVWQAKILRAQSHRDHDAFVVEATRLTVEISDARRRLPPNADLAEAEELADAVLRDDATTWHLEGQARGHRERGAAVDVVYRLWFSLFDDSPLSADMHFFHGELLFMLERCDEAVGAYEASIARDAHGHWAVAAAEQAVVAAYEALRRESTTSSTRPSPLTPSAARLVRLSDAAVAAAPTGRRVNTFRFWAVRVLFEAGRVDDGRARGFALIEVAPDAPEAARAAALILDDDAARGDATVLAVDEQRLRRYTTLER